MRPHGRARVNPKDPHAQAVCDLCGEWFNLVDLQFQFQWTGTHLTNIRSLRCYRCLDVPTEQLRTIILPPDPPPVLNARVPNFAYEEQTVRITQYGNAKPPPWGSGPQMIRCFENGETPRILQYTTSS